MANKVVNVRHAVVRVMTMNMKMDKIQAKLNRFPRTLGRHCYAGRRACAGALSPGYPAPHALFPVFGHNFQPPDARNPENSLTRPPPVIPCAATTSPPSSPPLVASPAAATPLPSSPPRSSRPLWRRPDCRPPGRPPAQSQSWLLEAIRPLVAAKRIRRVAPSGSADFTSTPRRPPSPD